VDLDTVADELYALHPNEFTGVRNERVKQAKADGDKELADQIRQLEKPTTSAWLVNRLAREHSEELEPLIELGRDLRESASDIGADELRELTRQRHRVVNALVQQARQLGAAEGSKVSDSVAGEVQQTLDASLADPDVADDVLAGRLTHAQEYAGFGAPMGGGAAASSRRSRAAGSGRPKAPARDKGGKGKQAEVADLAARRQENAQRALDEADRALEEARDRHKEASRGQDEASAQTRKARETVDRLRADLDAAEEHAREAARSERSTRHHAERAEEALDKAERARDRAAAKLEEPSE
jgi:hypothetical protein